MDTEVFGVSVDSWASHKVFKEQLNLPFDLLSDWGRDVSKKYGAFDEIDMVSTRKSFLVDKEGVIRFTQQASLNQPRNHDDMMRAVEKLAK